MVAELPSLHRYYYDWEYYRPDRFTYIPTAIGFIGDNDNDEGFCALFREYVDKVPENDWVFHKVIAPLRAKGVPELSTDQIINIIRKMISPAEEVQLWAKHDDHDRHLLTALLGGHQENAYSYFHDQGVNIVLPRDIIHFRYYLGRPQLPVQPTDQAHDPLNDARWVRYHYRLLREIAAKRKVDINYPMTDQFLAAANEHSELLHEL